MEIWYVFASIVLLVLLISWGKIQPFLAFLVASSVAAILLGLPVDKVPGNAAARLLPTNARS
jgi:Gnt-I system high-affinity gluconate transporter